MAGVILPNALECKTTPDGILGTLPKELICHKGNTRSSCFANISLVQFSCVLPPQFNVFYSWNFWCHRKCHLRSILFFNFDLQVRFPQIVISIPSQPQMWQFEILHFSDNIRTNEKTSCSLCLSIKVSWMLFPHEVYKFLLKNAKMIITTLQLLNINNPFLQHFT